MLFYLAGQDEVKGIKIWSDFSLLAAITQDTNGPKVSR
jgi:hypothetical protein